LALTWDPDTFLHCHWNYNDSSVTVTWSKAITGSDFDHYEIWLDQSTQSDATNRNVGGGAEGIDNNDIGALGTKTTTTATITEAMTTMVLSTPSTAVLYFAVFGVDKGDNYSTALTLQNRFLLGCEIYSVSQLTEDDSPGSKGDIKVVFELDSSGGVFATTNDGWLEFKDSNGYWQVCTAITSDGFSMARIREGVTKTIYWQNPKMDYGSAELSNLELRLVIV